MSQQLVSFLLLSLFAAIAHVTVPVTVDGMSPAKALKLCTTQPPPDMSLPAKRTLHPAVWG
jgi:hypothetical protein